MLKIAEYNKKTGKKIELEELEKYKFNFDGWIYVYGQNRFTGLRVEPRSRRIGLYNSADIIVEKETMNILYDLINDGYVEKVEI